MIVMQWYMFVIQILGKLSQEDSCNVKAILSYTVSTRLGGETYQDPMSQTNKQKKTKNRFHDIYVISFGEAGVISSYRNTEVRRGKGKDGTKTPSFQLQ